MFMVTPDQHDISNPNASVRFVNAGVFLYILSTSMGVAGIKIEGDASCLHE